jgi:uncharacterized membrane protein YbhN (UPF0104 family)
MLSLFSTKNLFSALKILVPLGLAMFLFWYLYKDGFSDTLQRMKEVKYQWVVLSMAFGIISHILRAYRWKLLMEPTGHYPNLPRSTMALFIGYLVNQGVPRLGEITRCLVLKRTDQIPVTSSLGTVVSERVLDVLSLLIITGITFLIEFEKLNEFFSRLFAEKFSGVFLKMEQNIIYIIIFSFLLLVLWYFVKSKIKKSSWWIKFRTFTKQMWLGFTSITKLKNPRAFWLATVGIWAMYYMMSLVVFYSMEPTAHLGWRAGLALLVMGGIAMSAPIQGGIGVYHLLVAGLLIYYGVAKEDGLSFAFLLHTSQMILIMLAGLVSSIVFLYLRKRPVIEGDSPP